MVVDSAFKDSAATGFKQSKQQLVEKMNIG
jgi:hypothetical protein